MSRGRSASVLTTPLAPLAAAGALAAGCLVVGMVDPARTPLTPPCPFRALTGLDCPGCGATRAAHQLLNGRVPAAVGLNAAFVLAVPVAAWCLLAWAVPRLGGPALPRPRLTPVRRVLLVVGVAAFTLVRNLPWAPFEALGT